MKTYDTFTEFYKDQSPSNRRIVSRLRKLVKKAAPVLTETAKWGNGCWVNDRLPAVYAHCENDHVQFGFFAGSMLKDPKKVLTGSGRFVRHVKLHSLKDIDERVLTPLIRQAAKLDYK